MTHEEEVGPWTSASNAQADLLCAGRHAASLGLPEVPSDDAESGTRIHKALAGELPVEQLSFDEREVYERCKTISEEVISQWRIAALPDATEQTE